MAIFALTNASITWNSVDLSDHLVSIDLPISAKSLDTTAMGDTFEKAIAGLKSWDGVTATFQQDYASGKVDATFGAGVIAGTTALATIQPVAGARSATNPGYIGSAFVKEYKAVAGNVGDLAMAQVTFGSAGSLTRAVA